MRIKRRNFTTRRQRARIAAAKARPLTAVSNAAESGGMLFLGGVGTFDGDGSYFTTVNNASMLDSSIGFSIAEAPADHGIFIGQHAATKP